MYSLHILDSLLKFIATIRLYINFPFENEGQLHHLRIRVICNRALYRSAKRLKFYRYVTSQAFNRRYWRPPKFTSPADNQETIDCLKYHKLSDKTLADILEACLGAAYLSNGLEGGLHAAIQLQIPFDEIKEWSDFIPAYEEQRKKVPPRAEVRALRLLNIPRLTEVVGRQFEKPLLLTEALTHASLPNSTSPCYQRLEFLGDAILDFLVIRYLFSKYPDGDPGLITDLKDSCVNNHVLGIICIETGLYKHIIHYSGKLIRAIEVFHGEVQEAKEKGEAVGEYWTDFNIPKVLSDVVESMLGAVFVDSGFRLEPCEELFARWFLPIFDNHVTPELIEIHPLRKLLTDLQRFGCDGFMLRYVTLSTSSFICAY
jgi:endoribonuclease Dicer